MLASKLKRGQSTAEYVIVLGLVVGAVIAMQTYVKRGLQARVKEATDFTYNPANPKDTDANFTHSVNMSIFNGSIQYEPYYLKSNFASARQGNTTTDLFNEGSAKGAGAYNKTITSDVSTRSGTQTLNITGLTENATHN